MKASTERTIKTLAYLAIVGAGGFWVWTNILPMLAAKLQAGGLASPATATRATEADWELAQAQLAAARGYSPVGQIASLLDGIGLDALSNTIWPNGKVSKVSTAVPASAQYAALRPLPNVGTVSRGRYTGVM